MPADFCITAVCLFCLTVSMNCDKITNEKDDVALTYIRPNKAKEKLYDKTFFFLLQTA